ncbi:uncharacterized protein FPRN_12040 [Fusarium proliferatum]|nr:uncharacterized protein FPRN_12040 [Fusarium proliferatum]
MQTGYLIHKYTE